AHSVNEVLGHAKVVVQRKRGCLAPKHRVGRGRLLGVMHDRLGLEFAKNPLHERPFVQVADENIDLPAGGFSPQSRALVQVGRGIKRVHVLLASQASAQVIVGDRDFVAGSGQMHRRGPAEIAVAAENQYFHACAASLSPGQYRLGTSPSTWTSSRPLSRRKATSSSCASGVSEADT